MKKNKYMSSHIYLNAGTSPALGSSLQTPILHKKSHI
jgi:hypothetical protein